MHSQVRFGSALELTKGIGPVTYVGTYVLTAISGNYAALTQSRHPALGASGAICGIMGFLASFAWRQNDKDKFNEVMRTMALLIIYGCITTGISNSAHIGGFLGGAVLAWVSGPTVVIQPKTILYREKRMVRRDPLRAKVPRKWLTPTVCLIISGEISGQGGSSNVGAPLR